MSADDRGDPVEGLRFSDLPVVLNKRQIEQAFELSDKQVRRLIDTGQLRRLRYHTFTRVFPRRAPSVPREEQTGEVAS